MLKYVVFVVLLTLFIVPMFVVTEGRQLGGFFLVPSFSLKHNAHSIFTTLLDGDGQTGGDVDRRGEMDETFDEPPLIPNLYIAM